MTGTLYGVGLGPGDPELMTVKAQRLIAAAGVVAYPAPDSGESFARSIAAGVIPANATELPIVIPMRAERFPAQAVYDEAATAISGHLEAGRNVVVLCEGDPFFYGSFMYLFARLADDYRCEIVPGVTSMTACSAVAGRPLCARNEVLTVVPAPAGEAELKRQLAGAGAAAIIKVGHHLPMVRKVLAQLAMTDNAIYVSHASLPNQVVVPLDDAPETAPYFSMILVAGRDPYAAR
jgi:precorrin-2/cobalt-factor-2 C20-methyltransferase